MPKHDLESGTSADTDRTWLMRDHVRSTWCDSESTGVCCIILFVLAVVLAGTMFGLGASRTKDCPAAPFIPVYLIGASGIPILIWLCKCKDRFVRLLTIIFLPTVAAGWLIAGNVFVYQIYGKFNKTNPTAANYCDPGLYYFTFVVNVFGYIGLIVGCICCGYSLCREPSQ